MENNIDNFKKTDNFNFFNIDLSDPICAYLDKNGVLSDKVRRCDNYYVNSEISCRSFVCGLQNTINDEESKLVEVLFTNSRMKFYRNDNSLPLKIYQYVIVDSENGLEICTIMKTGKTALEKYEMQSSKEVPEYNIIRIADENDISKFINNCEEEKEIVEQTKELVVNYNLDMKITNAEWQFDRQRLTVYFTAPQRVDFRELVKDLARTFRTRIELRQISSREEAKRLGGIGCCGLTLCCVSLLADFSHVTLDHARVQMLSNNVTKLSGNCGRLKCCLLFEYDSYVEAFKKYPEIDSNVMHPDGIARIIKVDIFKDSVLLHFEDSGVYKSLSLKELDTLKHKGKISKPKPDKTNAQNHNNNHNKKQNNKKKNQMVDALDNDDD